jgi:hypothetical protein
MAYLGNIGNLYVLSEGIWWNNVVAQAGLPAFLGQYATYGGYIYVG